MSDDDFKLKDECYGVVGACMELHGELGRGYTEAVYQHALAVVFEEKEIDFEREVFLPIFFHGRKPEKVYEADFLVFGEIIPELKAVSELLQEHRAQLINYLKITRKQVGLLIDFGKTSLQFERLVLEKNRSCA